MTLHIRDGGTWKSAFPYVRDGGVWKQPEVYVRDGGTWKLVHSPVSVSVSPTSRFASGSNSDYNFPACTVTVSDGTATSYNWYFTNVSLGSWSVWSGQGTASAAARCLTTDQGLNTADFKCDVVVNGQTYTVTVPHSYSYESGTPDS